MASLQRGKNPINGCFGYNTKVSDGEAPVLNLWLMWSTPSLPLLQCPFWPELVVLVRVPSMSQTELFNHLLCFEPFNCAFKKRYWIEFLILDTLYMGHHSLLDKMKNLSPYSYIYIYIYIYIFIQFWNTCLYGPTLRRSICFNVLQCPNIYLLPTSLFIYLFISIYLYLSLYI